MFIDCTGIILLHNVKIPTGLAAASRKIIKHIFSFAKVGFRFPVTQPEKWLV
jgi:hypothetical protein